MIIYLTGGLTFIPFVIFAFFYAQKLREQKQDQDSGTSSDPLLVKDIDPDFKAGEFEEAKGVKVFRRGWLTVTRRYYFHHTEIAPSSCDDSTNYIESDTPLRSQLKKKHKFYGILRHGNLFLYRDNLPKSSLVHAISLQGSFITMWPRSPNSELSDGALFTNKTCIAIWKKGTAKYEDHLEFQASENSEDDPSTNQYFLYFENTMEKEDWYFDLINVSKSEVTKRDKTTNVMDPNVSANTAHLNTSDMLYLIQTINSTEGQLSSQWFNALLGRLFLSLQRTDMLKNFLHGKLYDKLKKLNKPDFLEDLAVEEVNVGISAPMITNPKLMELSPGGLTKISLDFKYKGDISVMVTAKATINLGLRFKQREVPMQLSIKLKELSGPAVVMIKPPPSNRLWYTFVCEPIFEVEIEPVVSSSKLSYNMITNAIKSKLAEAMKESIVMPNWDDLVFYDTNHEIYRGGIWEKYDRNVKKPEDSSAEDTEVQDKQEIKLPLPVDKELIPENQMKSKSNGADHKTVENNDISMDALRTQDPTLKRRTLLKVENLKKVLKTKSRDDSSDELSINEVNMENPSASLDGETSEDSAGSKKLFKNPMKKIGKWYKDTVNNLPNTENDDPSDVDKGTIPKTYAPEMISNRRDLPKRPIPSNISTSASPATDPSSSTTSPTLNATEMFANKDRNKSLSSASSNEQNIGPYSPPNYNQSLPRAFVKERNTRDFHEGLFDEGLEERVSSTHVDARFQKGFTDDLKNFCHKIEEKVEQTVDEHTNLRLSDNSKNNNAT